MTEMGADRRALPLLRPIFSFASERAFRSSGMSACRSLDDILNPDTGRPVRSRKPGSDL